MDILSMKYFMNFNSNRDEFNAIIYDEDSILSEKKENIYKRMALRSHSRKVSISEAASKIIYKKFIEDRHICPLLVILDNSFLKKIHKDDVMAAVAQVMLSINVVNSVFRSTDFDGDGTPDNIGFIIKYLVVIQNEDSPYNYIPLYSEDPVSPRFYLAHFAQYLILREVCLGILFTAQSFQDNVLGVSYSAVSENDISNEIIGGICQRPFTSYMLSLNAVAVSYISTQGLYLPQGTIDTCLTHELGHAFGCRHDRKSDPGYNEEYIMSSHTLPGTNVKNFQFSPMSKKHLVMTVPKKGHCMLKSTEAFCGNGIREQGEECDCGGKYLCQSTDPCCIPSGMHGACQINRAEGHECHPSQGFCCTSQCKYENLENIGVECHLINRTCPCDVGNCECGIGGRCLGNECQSEECVRIDAKECDCPASLFEDSCSICCLVNPGGSCLPSRNLTQWKLELGLITIKQLEKFDALRVLPNATDFERFCHGIDCITLSFKKFTVGDYCLKNGMLGRCGTFGCSLESSKFLDSEKNSRNIVLLRSSGGWLSRSFYYSYYIYCSFLIKFQL
ncbi:disintegrin and metalloproteinase domain-containing protein 10-like isoform X2 [Harmonia axyridis]|uniref:disintegrin and metalloproteinase domain-containing protein 10-like isoform X2 n=1 Tax=Harmonia axyridis TaxID=115357 RepID=UPI001E276F63|nr:disintegrin and metalloproteinase domain-containing protein 10-like isoform X2 [Harmonia axyridis]